MLAGLNGRAMTVLTCKGEHLAECLGEGLADLALCIEQGVDSLVKSVRAETGIGSLGLPGCDERCGECYWQERCAMTYEL